MRKGFRFRIGSRRSPLARAQAEWVGRQLEAKGHLLSHHYIRTQGDRSTSPLEEIGTQGIFTKALEEALASDEIDLAVHSAKDLPARLLTEFTIIAFTERELPHDVLVVSPTVRGGSGVQGRIGTSSVRRAAQIAHYFPEAEVVALRGNVETRLAALLEGRCEALLLAYAALVRSGHSSLVAASMHPSYFVPAAGQGSLAIEVLKTMPTSQQQTLRLALNHKESEVALQAERAFLAKLGAGCHTPAFALAEIRESFVHLHAGRYYKGKCLRKKQRAALHQAERLGKDVAEHILKLMHNNYS